MKMTVRQARKLALSFKEAVELPHFDLTSFRVRKKIFATMDVNRKRMCLMLTPVDQSVFCAYNPAIIYPVPNKWGKKGATYFELATVRASILKDALVTSYRKAAPAVLAMHYSPAGSEL